MPLHLYRRQPLASDDGVQVFASSSQITFSINRETGGRATLNLLFNVNKNCPSQTNKMAAQRTLEMRWKSRFDPRASNLVAPPPPQSPLDGVRFVGSRQGLEDALTWVSGPSKGSSSIPRNMRSTIGGAIRTTLPFRTCAPSPHLPSSSLCGRKG